MMFTSICRNVKWVSYNNSLLFEKIVGVTATTKAVSGFVPLAAAVHSLRQLVNSLRISLSLDTQKRGGEQCKQQLTTDVSL